MKYTGRQRIEPIQPPCKKTIFQSQEEANDMIRHINETRVTRNIRAYECPVCGYWHLTSKQGK
ncbi:MAG: hypothetical protein ACM3UT_00770 [Chloroflexota bacterium]